MGKTLTSRKLNLAEAMLSRGRTFHCHGQLSLAADALKHLTSLAELPLPIAEETQKLLAEIALERRQFKQARRHLLAALALDPEEGTYHYLMAVAIEEDQDANQARARRHYLQAVSLEPENATYQCDFGLYLCEQGKWPQARKRLEKAAELAPDDPEIVGHLAECLRRHGEEEEATRVLRLARFRNSGNRRFADLWERHQFELLHHRQQRALRKSISAESDQPVLLPFRPLVDTPTYQGKLTRWDGRSTLRGPKGSVRLKLANRKNAR